MLRPSRPVSGSLALVCVAASLTAAACSPAPPASAPPGAASSASAAVTAAPTATPEAPGHRAADAPAAAPATAAASATAAAPATASAPAAAPPTLILAEPTKVAGKPPVLGIAAPAKNQVIPAAKAAAFEARVTAKDWKPAAGAHLCVVLDRRPCRRVDDPAKPLKLSELGALDEGQHVLSVLARHASGEFFRGEGKAAPFASVSFFVGKKAPVVHKDGAPMLFYSGPEPGPAPPGGVLIDFFVANGTVRSGEHVVTASVGGPGIESGIGIAVEQNRPLLLVNAQAGEYLSRLRLLAFVPELGESKELTTVTYTAKPVAGPFGEVERTFVVGK